MIQRYKGALTTGNWPDNPESLVRDKDGDYVLYDDCKIRCVEASAMITQLCTTFNIPLPEDTLKRLGV